MFAAGFIPGIAMGVLLMIAIYIVARKNELPAEPFPGVKEVLASFGSAIGGIMLIVIVLGSIYGGVASPTEAAAMSAVYAYLVSVYGYRDMGPLKGVAWIREGDDVISVVGRNIWLSLKAIPKTVTDPDVSRTVNDAAKVAIMLLFIIANAMLFAHVLTTERIPHRITAFIVEMGLPAWGFLIFTNILLLMAGNFMEPTSITLIMAPILHPIALQLGIDPIHLGIVMVVNMEIGMITPPVGLNPLRYLGNYRRVDCLGRAGRPSMADYSAWLSDRDHLRSTGFPFPTGPAGVDANGQAFIVRRHERDLDQCMTESCLVSIFMTSTPGRRRCRRH